MTALYQLTNLDNAKLYIGVHTCSQEHKVFANGVCQYMGSGRAIKAAVKKHGVERFKKDVLYANENEAFIYRLEAAVVDKAFIARADTYNVGVGGDGGDRPQSRTADASAKRSESLKQAYATGRRVPWQCGKRLFAWTEERRAKVAATWTPEARQQAADHAKRGGGRPRTHKEQAHG